MKTSNEVHISSGGKPFVYRNGRPMHVEDAMKSDLAMAEIFMNAGYSAFFLGGLVATVAATIAIHESTGWSGSVSCLLASVPMVVAWSAYRWVAE